MERRRLLELALESLQLQKAGIDADIEALKAELQGTGTAMIGTQPSPSAGIRRRTRTAAERLEISKRMKKAWAARKAKAAKPADKKRYLS